MVQQVAQHNEQLQELMQRSRGLVQGLQQEQPPHPGVPLALRTAHGCSK